MAANTLTMDEARRLHDRAAALTPEEKQIFIEAMPDDLLYEEIGRRLQGYRDFAYKFRSVARDFKM